MKMELTAYNVNVFRSENKIILKDMRLLLEAFRRYEFMDNGKKDIDSNFLGLGVRTNYKSDLFKPSFNEVKRANNWYKLTPLGKEHFIKFINTFTIPTVQSYRNEINLILYNGLI